jgi:dihydropteroate synthase
MEYHEAVNFLFDLRRFQVKPGIESVRELLAELGEPQAGIEFVQVAGSNGKGSTARMVESVLRETDARVGLFVSPHMEDVRERVQVDGRRIPERAVAAFVDRAKPYLVERAAAGTPLTFFEAVTAMAVWYFDRADVDVAVLEVGMGGELDATSAVDPVASAVTNVTMEHTDVLGDTVEEIARTKAHVAPADNPLVTAATGAALSAVREQAGAVCLVGEAGTGADVEVRYEGRANHTESTVSVAGPDWRLQTRIPLLGAFQARNAGIAATLARQIVGDDLSAETVARGLRAANWPGRFEVMERDPIVVLDGAHNPNACEEVASVLDEFDYDDLHLVFGAMHDKDHRGMAAGLPEPASVVTCRPGLDRAETPEVLARVFEDAHPDADVLAGESVADGLARARERADANDCVLVTGSLFCVAEARTDWTRLAVPRRVADAADARRVLETANVPASTVETTASRAVHEVVTTTVDRREAAVLRETMRELGGECAVSGHRNGGERLSVVLAGTRAAYEALVEELDGAGFGLPGLATTLRRRLGIDDGSPERGYPWESSPSVMGILNVTPDSFHDGGEYVDTEAAVERARAMVDAGADIVDVGGESTRPGADPVPVEEEISRVVPVVEAIADVDVHVSIDTRKPRVAAAALDAGADILNDVTGLEDPEMRLLAAERDVPVVVMHSIDAPVVPGKDVPYDDVVGDVVAELERRVLLAEQAGLTREQILVDPGLGFGKSAVENFALLDRLEEFAALGCPILVGHSHKSMFELADQDADERLPATVAATALAVDRGADVVRVHDVAENVAAVQTALATADPHRFDDGGD